MNKKYISVFKKQSYSILLIFFSILTFVLIYNSCTDEILYSKILNPFPQNFDITINDGDLSTNRPDVLLSLKVPQKDTTQQKISFEMKISEKPDCADGKWEPYSPSKNWSLSVNPGKKEEPEISVYVQFREKRHPGVSYTYRTEEFAQMKGASKCFRTSIVYDRSPPRNFKLFDPPAEPTNQKTANFKFSGEDYSSIHFECKLLKKGLTTQASLGPILPVRNKKTYGKASKKKIRKKAFVLRKTANTQSNPWDWHPCGSPTSKKGFETSGVVSYGDPTSPLFTDPLEDGEYIFSVRAKDSLGNRSKDSLNYEWKVDSTVPSIVFLSSLCDGRESSTKRNIFVDTIPIKIDAPNPPQSERTFSIQCKNGDIWSTPFGETRMEPPNKRLEIPKTCFNSTPSTDFSFYSDTIYKKYTVTVKAVDDQGNAGGEKTCTWKILPQNTKILVDDQAPQNRKKKADILFIIDHSKTIKEEADALSSNFERLVGFLSELDWQIASTSMEKEYLSASPYYSGDFLSIRLSACPVREEDSTKRITGKAAPLPTNQYILSHSNDCSDPIYCSTSTSDLQDAFEYTTKCPDFTYHWARGEGIEYGIRAVYRILTQYQLANRKTRSTQTATLSYKEKAFLQFFRKDATFVTIFLTDEKNCNNDNTDTSKDPNNYDGFKISENKGCQKRIDRNHYSNLCHNFLEGRPFFKLPRNSNPPPSDFPDDLIQKVKCLFGDDKKFLAYPIVPKDFQIVSKSPESPESPENPENPEKTEHYLDLAIKTQGTDENNVIRVDFDNIVDYTGGLQTISEDIVTITSKTLHLPCKPRNETPASKRQLRIPGPTYFFKPTNGTFTEMTPHQPQTNSPSYTHTFVTGDKKHYIKIQESWKILDENDQRAIRAKLKPAVGPSSTTSKDPSLPNGTYRVEYLCDPSSV